MLNPRNRLSVWLLRLCVVLLIALAIVTAQWMGAEKQKQIAEKQRHIAEVKIEADLATEWFETHPTQALLMAMRSVYKLKNLEKTEKLGEYPTAEPIMALQTILNQIQARQYYDGRLLYTSEDGEIEFPDGPDTYISSNNNGRVVFTDKGDRFIYSGNLSRSRGSRLRFSPLFPFFRFELNRDSESFFVVYDLQGNQISEIIKKQDKYPDEPLEREIWQISPDGELILLPEIISISSNNYLQRLGKARLLNMQGKPIATLQSPEKEAVTWSDSRFNIIPQYQFSPDSQYIIAQLPYPHDIYLWNRQGKLLGKIENQLYLNMNIQRIFDVKFSPDSKSILTAGIDGISLWNLQGKKINTFNEPQIPTNIVQFSPDGKRISSYHVDGTVNWWNLQGEQLATFKIPQLGLLYNDDYSFANNASGLQGHIDRSELFVELSPNGKYVATINSRYGKRGIENKRIQVLDLSGNELARLEFFAGFNQVDQLQFSPDSQRLMIKQDIKSSVWNWQDNKSVTFSSEQQQVVDVKISPDGKHILTEFVKKPVVGDLIPKNNQEEQYYFSLWNLQGKKLSTIDLSDDDPFPEQADFTPQSDRILTADGQVYNFQGVLSAELPGIFPYNDRNKYSFNSDSGHFTPDDQFTATIKYDGSEESQKVQISDLSGNIMASLPKIDTNLRDIIENIDFSPKGDLLLTVEKIEPNTTIRLWNFQGKEVKTLSTYFDANHVYAYFTANGDRIIVFQQGIFELWNLEGNRLKKIDRDKLELESAREFEDGVYFQSSLFDRHRDRFFAGDREGNLILADINGKVLAIFPAVISHFSLEMIPHQTLQWSTDGKRIATRGTDGIIRVWNSKGKQISQYPGRSMALSPDGEKIVVVDPQDGIPRLWQIEDVDSLLAKGCDWLGVIVISIKFETKHSCYDKSLSR